MMPRIQRRPAVPLSSSRTTTVAAKLLLVLLTAQLSSSTCRCEAKADVRRLQFDDDDTPLPVIIGYKRDGSAAAADNKNTATLASSSSTGGADGSSSASSRRADPRLAGGAALDRISARKGTLTRSEVQALVDADPDILYVEPDYVLRPLAEVVPYGVEDVAAYGPYPPAPPAVMDGGAPCSDPTSFKIGIVDSGLDAAHPDLPCYNANDPSIANCVGKTFGLGLGDDEWSTPTDIHGTFVTGVIGAVRGNGIGVTGVLNNRNVCLVAARVFGGSGSSEGQALMSDVLEGVQYVADQGASVINLSLGGPGYSQTADAFYQSINDENRLVFCASGNDGTADLFYPASYPSTVSVGAVDSAGNRAAFSQYNQEVDLVAPGQGILSTAPLGGGNYLYEVDAGGQAYISLLLSGSPEPPSQIAGSLVACPDLGQSVCPGDGTGGHICLIERGTVLFGDKALNCQNGGGAAAIIYNTADEYFPGTVGSASGQLTIPVYAVDRATGQALLQQSSATLTAQDGYAVADGTSFASPYAAGAAAAVWQGCRACTSADVRGCLQDTARDLGAPGRDDQYGHGLVQADAAYLCLVQTNGCCAGAGAGGASPAAPTTPAPIPGPVPAPPASSPAASPTPPADACSTLETAYRQCLSNDAGGGDGGGQCLSCVRTALTDAANAATTCDAFQTAVCSATRGDCQCYTCGDEIEAFLACAIPSYTDCPALDCSGYQPGGGGGAIDVRRCAGQQLDVGSCLSLSTADAAAAAAPAQQDPEESECVRCLLGSLPPTFDALSCYEVNQNHACPLLDACSGPCIMSQCSRQVVDYVDCVVGANAPGCSVSCDGYGAGSGGGNAALTSGAPPPALAAGLWKGHLLVSVSCGLAAVASRMLLL